MNPRYEAVAARAAHRCEYCHAPEAAFNLAHEVEHILPVARGGANDMDNLALACRACNVFKADHQTGPDPQTPTPVRLFPPRQDRWAEHFYVDQETGTVQGRTLFGRATVARLQMNTAFQRGARLLWLRFGLFP